MGYYELSPPDQPDEPRCKNAEASVLYLAMSAKSSSAAVPSTGRALSTKNIPNQLNHENRGFRLF